MDDFNLSRVPSTPRDDLKLWTLHRLIQHRNKPLINLLRMFGRIPNGGETEFAEGGNLAEHVQNHARLRNVIVVQTVVAHEIEQVGGGEGVVGVVFQGVGGDIRFGVAEGGVEDAGVRIVTAIGEVLEGEEGMSRAPFAEVDLDGVGVPPAILAFDDKKIEGEPSDDAFFREAFADLFGFVHDHGAVFGMGGETRAEVHLPGRAAEHLIVRGKEFDIAERGVAELRAGANHHVAGDHFFDNATFFGKFVHVPGVIYGTEFKAEVAQAGGEGVRFGGMTGVRQPREVQLGVAITGDAFVQFDDQFRQGGFFHPHSADRGNQIGGGVDVFFAEGVGETFFGEQATASGLGAEVEVVGVGGVHGEVEADGEFAFEFGGDEGDEVGAVGVGNQTADVLEQERAVEKFVDERTFGGVLGGDENEAAARVVAGDAGEEVEVVVYDFLRDGDGGEVDQADTGLAEEEEHEEHPFFVTLLGGEVYGDIYGHGGHDDDGVFVFEMVTAGVGAANVLPQGDEFGLQFVKAGVEVGDGGGHESSFVLRGGKTGRFYPKSSWFKNKRPNWDVCFSVDKGRVGAGQTSGAV